MLVVFDALKLQLVISQARRLNPFQMNIIGLQITIGSCPFKGKSTYMVVVWTNTQSVSNVEVSKQFVRVVLSKATLEFIKQVVVLAGKRRRN